MSTDLFRAHRNLWLTAVALGVLAVGWLVSPAHVPLYDGVGFPDEPYRYVQPLPGYQHTPPPTKATAASPVSSAVNLQAVYATSREQGPQVTVFLAPGHLQVPAGATTVAVVAAPLAPDGQPPSARIDGNVYRVAVRSDAPGPVRYDATGDAAGSSSSSVMLRATSASQPGPTMFFRPSPGGAWHALPTDRAGNDVYRVRFAGFGDYALAFVTHPQGSPATGEESGTGGASGGTTLAVMLSALLAAVVVVIGVRLARQRAA